MTNERETKQKPIAWKFDEHSGEHRLKTDLLTVRIAPAGVRWEVSIVNAGGYVRLHSSECEGGAGEAKRYGLMQLQKVVWGYMDTLTQFVEGGLIDRRPLTEAVIKEGQEIARGLGLLESSPSEAKG